MCGPDPFINYLGVSTYKKNDKILKFENIPIPKINRQRQKFSEYEI